MVQKSLTRLACDSVGKPYMSLMQRVLDNVHYASGVMFVSAVAQNTKNTKFIAVGQCLEKVPGRL